MDRGERRARTLRICARRRKLWLWSTGGNHIRPATLEPFYFTKAKPLDCDCRRSRRGNPKVGKGLCNNAYDRIRVVHWRQARRTLRQLVRDGRSDWDSDEVALVTEPRVEIE